MPELPKWRLSRQAGRDLHPGRFVEAICPHGVGHHRGIHGCDGCCSTDPAGLMDQTTKDTP